MALPQSPGGLGLGLVNLKIPLPRNISLGLREAGARGQTGSAPQKSTASHILKSALVKIFRIRIAQQPGKARLRLPI